jgi:hypothetical protein
MNSYPQNCMEVNCQFVSFDDVASVAEVIQHRRKRGTDYVLRFGNDKKGSSFLLQGTIPALTWEEYHLSQGN